MGVYYDPILAIGWEINPEVLAPQLGLPIGDDEHELVELIAKEVGLMHCEAGDYSYGGERRWYLTVKHNERVKLSDIPAMAERLNAIKSAMAMRGIVLPDPEIICDLHVW
jgi:hypothetical protein